MAVKRENIVAARWFSCLTGQIGAVLYRDEYVGHKVYIGPAVGLVELDDRLYIAEWGARVTDRALCAALFPHVTGWAGG